MSNFNTAQKYDFCALFALYTLYSRFMYTLRKSLGQHFLRDENISRKIVAALTLPFTRLLEVGPGGGALTKYLMDLEGVDFKAVELDVEKIGYLLTTWPALQGKILPGSILQLGKPFDDKFAVIGNFPYNISTQILFKLLDWRTDLLTVILSIGVIVVDVLT